MSDEPDGAGLPLNANAGAYTALQSRDGIPLSYVAEKLKCAIEDLHRHGRRCYEARIELRRCMYYLLVAHLALHNMLAKANDLSLVDRLLDGSSENLNRWLRLVEREGDVQGIADLES